MNFFVGFITALLSGLGIGGGGLLVIWLVLVKNTEQLTAQGINLLFFLFSSCASMVVHLIKRSINWRLVAYMIFFGCIGAVIGSTISKSIEPEIIRTSFGGLLIISGIITLFK